MKGQKKKRKNLVAPTVTSLAQDLVIATDKPEQKIDVEPDKIYFTKETDIIVEQKNDVFEIVNSNKEHHDVDKSLEKSVDKSIKPIEEKSEANTIEDKTIEKPVETPTPIKTPIETPVENPIEIPTLIEEKHTYNLDNVKTFIKKNKDERSNYFKHLYCNIQ
jgi:hypothetical protein